MGSTDSGINTQAVLAINEAVNYTDEEVNEDRILLYEDTPTMM